MAQVRRAKAKGHTCANATFFILGRTGGPMQLSLYLDEQGANATFFILGRTGGNLKFEDDYAKTELLFLEFMLPQEEIEDVDTSMNS